MGNKANKKSKLESSDDKNGDKVKSDNEVKVNEDVKKKEDVEEEKDTGVEEKKDIDDVELQKEMEQIRKERGLDEEFSGLVRRETALDEEGIKMQKEIHALVREGRIDKLKRLLRQKKDYFVKNHHLYTIGLWEGCKLSDAAVVDLFLGANYENRLSMLQQQDDKDLATALHMAAQNGSIEVTKILLAAGAPVVAVDKKGLSPIDVCTNCAVESLLLQKEVEMFVKKGTDSAMAKKIYEHKKLLAEAPLPPARFFDYAIICTWLPVDKQKAAYLTADPILTGTMGSKFDEMGHSLPEAVGLRGPVEGMFSQYDVEGHGMLGPDEIGPLLRDLTGVEYDQSQVKKILRAFDSDSQGFLGLPEFTHLWMTKGIEKYPRKEYSELPFFTGEIKKLLPELPTYFQRYEKYDEMGRSKRTVGNSHQDLYYSFFVQMLAKEVGIPGRQLYCHATSLGSIELRSQSAQYVVLKGTWGLLGLRGGFKRWTQSKILASSFIDNLVRLGIIDSEWTYVSRQVTLNLPWMEQGSIAIPFEIVLAGENALPVPTILKVLNGASMIDFARSMESHANANGLQPPITRGRLKMVILDEVKNVQRMRGARRTLCLVSHLPLFSLNRYALLHLKNAIMVKKSTNRLNDFVGDLSMTLPIDDSLDPKHTQSFSEVCNIEQVLPVDPLTLNVLFTYFTPKEVTQMIGVILQQRPLIFVNPKWHELLLLTEGLLALLRPFYLNTADDHKKDESARNFCGYMPTLSVAQFEELLMLKLSDETVGMQVIIGVGGTEVEVYEAMKNAKYPAQCAAIAVCNTIGGPHNVTYGGLQLPTAPEPNRFTGELAAGSGKKIYKGPWVEQSSEGRTFYRNTRTNQKLFERPPMLDVLTTSHSYKFKALPNQILKQTVVSLTPFVQDLLQTAPGTKATKKKSPCLLAMKIRAVMMEMYVRLCDGISIAKKVGPGKFIPTDSTLNLNNVGVRDSRYSFFRVFLTSSIFETFQKDYCNGLRTDLNYRRRAGVSLFEEYIGRRNQGESLSYAFEQAFKHSEYNKPRLCLAIPENSPDGVSLTIPKLDDEVMGRLVQ
eukprot:g4850.t1